MRGPSVRAVVQLVRLPAVLSVPGDVLLGTAASGQLRALPRTAGLTAASSCLYLAGMALNDYADREVDARERPARPIPSGRVTPRFALGLAGGLTLASVALAVGADGPRALKVAAPLVATVWSYDLKFKGGLAGPAAMSACRALDVLMGAGAQGTPRALPAAAVVGAHTAVVTTVSAREAQGGSRELALGALAATAGVVTAAAWVAERGSRSAWSRAAALGLLAAYAAVVGGAQAAAARGPSPERLQRAVGAGVVGLMPLQAGLLAGAGALLPAVSVAALWPLARALARRTAVT